MTLQLPVMNYLAQRWNLPSEIIKQADYYRLKRAGLDDFLLSCVMTPEGKLETLEAGILFEVIFQKNADKGWHKEVWISYRSLTFSFQGKMETKSFAIVQPVFPGKQEGKIQGKMDRSPKAEGPQNSPVFPSWDSSRDSSSVFVTMKYPPFKTFAERSLPSEPSED